MITRYSEFEATEEDEMETDENCVEVGGNKSAGDGVEELWLNCGVGLVNDVSPAGDAEGEGRKDMVKRRRKQIKNRRLKTMEVKKKKDTIIVCALADVKSTSLFTNRRPP